MAADPTAADLIVEALRDSGIDIVFANLGSDHPALIEAFAKARDGGVALPAVVLCPHETTALAAAHGRALATGRPQAVVVHTDVGTANLGGAVHNAAKAHVPVLVFAGLTPFTMEGELPGTRDSQVNSMQDSKDQHGIVRPYVKWSYDLRTGRNASQIIRRGIQLADTAPKGPVYVTGAREVLAEQVPRPAIEPHRWAPVERTAIPAEILDEILDDLAWAAHPVIVTSAIGDRPEAVPVLVELAELLGIGVVETVRVAMNFPADHPLHLGYAAARVVPDADVLLVIESDSPWIPSAYRPAERARVHFIDPDPLKADIPLWTLSADRFVRADGLTAVTQLLARAKERGDGSAARVRSRTEMFTAMHEQQRAAWRSELAADGSGAVTAPAIAATLAGLLDEEAIVLNETITNLEHVFRHLPRNRPGTFFANRGTSLGWSGGAALGMAIDRPAGIVVDLIGDGTFHFTVPTSTYAVAGAYGVAFLTVIFDNGGWNATKQNLLNQYPGGSAADSGRYWVGLPEADLAGVAGAFGAWTAHVRTRSDLEPVLREAIATVRAGRPAVVQAHLQHITAEPLDELPSRER